MARYSVTIEIKDTPDDTLPDIGTEVVWYEGMTLEEVKARCLKIADLQNEEFEAKGLTQRARVVDVEPIDAEPERTPRVSNSLFL